MVITCFGERLKGSLPDLRLFSDFFCLCRLRLKGKLDLTKGCKRSKSA